MNSASDELRKRAVDLLCLGSWHTFRRMNFDENAAFIQAALDRGIIHFDIADYWDHEMLNTIRFKEVVKRLGLPRDSYKIGLKVFTTSDASRVEVVKGLLELLELEYADSVLCSRPNLQETLTEAVEDMNDLVVRGLTKELDFSLWDAPQLKEAFDLMQLQNMNTPHFVQFQYNLCRRDVVESVEYQKLFETTGMKLQAAFPLEGGILAGNITRRRFDADLRDSGVWFKPEDRNIARDSGNIRGQIISKVPRLIEVAGQNGMSAAQLALAFTATHPHVGSVLFGATKVWQLDEAIEAMELALTKPAYIRQLAEEFYVSGSQPPKLFDYSRGIH